MRRLIKKFRKSLKTMCLSAAMVTCWGIGQSTQASLIPPIPISNNDEVMVRFSGTVTPTTHNLTKLYLIYGTGLSSWIWGPWRLLLGNFPAGVTTPYSVTGPAGTSDDVYFWMVVGLYGDVSSGQYDMGNTNGVTVSLDSSGEGKSWSYLFGLPDEETVFDNLINQDTETLLAWGNQVNKFQDAISTDMVFTDSSVLYNFSLASPNGTIEIQSQIVPEPMSIVFIGIGGILVWRRSDNET